MSSRSIKEVLTRDEIRGLLQASDGMGALAVLTDWGLIALAGIWVALWPNALSVATALVIIGGRQLGLAVLMHEAAHRSLFRTRRLNDFVGRWLCGAPVWTDVHRYRVHHLDHHNHTGTERDPDRCLVTPFPTSRSSLARKLLRDLMGVTAARRVVGLLAMDFDVLTYTASGDARRIEAPTSGRIRRGFGRLAPAAITNAGLLGLLWASGHPELYLLWVGAWATTFSAFIRVRAIAEHACTDDDPDVFRNTRTTRANPLARLTVAPHHVAYHLEHHLLMTVPYFRLPALHRLLRERGALADSHLANGYLPVLRQASARRG